MKNKKDTEKLPVECPCGNSTLYAEKVTLTLRGLPFHLDENDGPQYDDGEAENSEGWDYNEESRVHCRNCKRAYDIVQDGLAGFGLVRKGKTP